MAARILARLSRLNPTTLFLTTVGIVVISLFVGGPVAALVLLALGLGLLTVLVRLWPHLDGRGRTARILLLATIGLFAVLQLTR